MEEVKFNVILLNEAQEFMSRLDDKIREKIFYNIRKSRFLHDSKLFKKLSNEIWEFRTAYGGIQYRLFAFWDKSAKDVTLVIATHGMIKKTDKVPKQEIEKAERIRKQYFQTK